MKKVDKHTNFIDKKGNKICVGDVISIKKAHKTPIEGIVGTKIFDNDTTNKRPAKYFITNDVFRAYFLDNTKPCQRTILMSCDEAEDAVYTSTDTCQYGHELITYDFVSHQKIHKIYLCINMKDYYFEDTNFSHLTPELVKQHLDKFVADLNAKDMKEKDIKVSMFNHSSSKTENLESKDVAEILGYGHYNPGEEADEHMHVSTLHVNKPNFNDDKKTVIDFDNFGKTLINYKNKTYEVDIDTLFMILAFNKVIKS